MVPTESEGLAVEVLDLVKRYPKSPVNAVDGVSFAAAPGEVFGLLGPNGAGKTTTVGMLTTRVRPTAGTARIGGMDVVRDPVTGAGAARRRAAAEQPRPFASRSGTTSSSTRRTTACRRASARSGPTSCSTSSGCSTAPATSPIFSPGGQSQRVMIARALMHAPRVLFLDEPTTGLDPAARLFVWDRLRELSASDVTLILTTHDMDEAALLAGRVGIMDHGHLLALDTPDALISSLEGEGTLELTADQAADGTVVDALAGLAGVERVETVHLATENGGPEAPPSKSEPLRVRLYLTGDAALVRCPRSGRPHRAWAGAPGREARRTHAGGRLHPPHGTDAALSAVAAPVLEPGTQWRAFRAVLYRDLYVTWREFPAFLAQVILQPLFLLFVFGKVLEQPQLHAARLHGRALSRAARADRGDHGDAGARLPARGRVRLD